MENRQLERELRSIIQGLKAGEITRVVQLLESEEAVFLNKNFTKSGVNCTCCTLTHDKLIATGFGRNQQQALLNATKNYLETLVSTNTLIPQLKHALKLRQDTQHVPSSVGQKERDRDDTLQLCVLRDLGDMSAIVCEQQVGCSCIYYEVHKHHMSEIRNMEARMKLLVRENEMLKQLLLKDVNRSKSYDKENIGLKANSAKIDM